MTKKEHLKQLREDVRGLLADASSLHTLVDWGPVSYTLYSDFLDYYNHQLGTLDTILSLVEKQRYRDALVLLRSSFEHYLIFMLYTGGKYYFTRIRRRSGEKNLAAAKVRIEKEIENLEASKRSYFKVIQKDDLLLLRTEGPYIDGIRGKGRLVPWYYRLLEQYDGKAAYLYTGKQQKYFFSWAEKENLIRWHGNNKAIAHYLQFNNILESLELNNFCKKKTRSYMLAHYNFLSQFTHPTNSSIEIVNNRKQNPYQHYSNLWTENEDLELICLLYAGYIAAGFLGVMINTLENAPVTYILRIRAGQVKNRINVFYESYKYFWFIYNGCSDYDKFNASISKSKRKTSKEVKFEADILARLRNLQNGMQKMTGEKYTPPFFK